GRGIANGRGGNPFRGGESAQPVGAGAAQEFVASSLSALREEAEAARLSDQRGGVSQTGMGISGKRRGANRRASLDVRENTLLRLVADNRAIIASKSRASIALVSSR